MSLSRALIIVAVASSALAAQGPGNARYERKQAPWKIIDVVVP